MHFKCEEVADTLFKLINIKESVSIAINLVNFFPYKVPVAWAFAHQTGQKLSAHLLQALELSVQNLLVFGLLQLDQLVDSARFSFELHAH